MCLTLFGMFLAVDCKYSLYSLRHLKIPRVINKGEVSQKTNTDNSDISTSTTSIFSTQLESSHQKAMEDNTSFCAAQTAKKMYINNEY